MDPFEDDREDMYDDDIDSDHGDGYEEEEEEEEEEEDDSEEPIADKQNHLILKKDDLAQRLEHDINEVMSVLSITKYDACVLLIRYNWSVGDVQEAWFDNEVKVRESVGLLDVDPDVKFPKTSNELVLCGICFESVRVIDTANCGCGHSFCNECWKSYVSTSIDGGMGCLTLKCPQPKCGAAVGPDMVNVLVDDEEKKRYDRFVVMSYVERNKKVKWCPGPGCEYAVEFAEDDHDMETGDDDFDVYCGCKYGFCWKCSEDAHRPLDCETVAKWVIKNSAEAENTKWILAYTKPCPNCKKSIEKNEGCMHMTCKCGHHFCWLCLGSFGGYDHACNHYEEHAKTKEDITRERAKNSIEKYIHYYERWAANENSRKKALSDLEEIKTDLLEKIGSIYDQNVTQLQFIEEAWLQIVKCRRILKWTYAYGYYIPENEEGKKNMFEYLQGEAEGVLERLHHCVEKELKSDIGLANFGDAIEAFDEFRQKLASLTKVTKSYFENLVTALKKGLPEVWMDEKAWNADYVLGETDLFNL
uniref:probable E3 ubiquitin-protein ligase ARI8 n=1 Tax=Erigeron canadensis TaxID=72917 RepID=UPI001CB97BDB|nr:probable E3 ubiquitin-protein ligase ARI8 [Erigeron canadensis]